MSLDTCIDRERVAETLQAEHIKTYDMIFR